ncbi:Os01g0813700, partial [Oryza sativa Japonica Group]
ALQKGIVGINMFSLWSYPLTNSIADLQAAQRYKDFSYGWYDQCCNSFIFTLKLADCTILHKARFYRSLRLLLPFSYINACIFIQLY